MMTTMKRNKRQVSLRLIRLAGLFGLVAVLSGCGLTAPRSSEGFADLESLGMRDTDTVMTLSIGPSLLHFAAGHVDDEPELRELLKNLDGVRIRIYEINGDASRVTSRINAMSGHLQDDGWEPVMLIREENEATHMLIRTVDQQICGMTVLVTDGDTEAVVINLMGEIQPQQFGDVMLALDVDTPGVENVKVAGETES
jgi:hypothetical protein